MAEILLKAADISQNVASKQAFSIKIISKSNLKNTDGQPIVKGLNYKAKSVNNIIFAEPAPGSNNKK